MAMKTKFINIRIRESNDGEPSCFDIDAGGSLDDILHMLCGGMDAIVTQFCAEDGDEKNAKRHAAQYSDGDFESCGCGRRYSRYRND